MTDAIYTAGFRGEVLAIGVVAVLNFYKSDMRMKQAYVMRKGGEILSSDEAGIPGRHIDICRKICFSNTPADAKFFEKDLNWRQDT